MGNSSYELQFYCSNGAVLPFAVSGVTADAALACFLEDYSCASDPVEVYADEVAEVSVFFLGNAVCVATRISG